MQTMLFVDYENVNRVGLNGILKLSETDCVRIYYSKNAEAMTFGLHRRINASKAKFQYVKVQMPIKMPQTVWFCIICKISQDSERICFITLFLMMPILTCPLRCFVSWNVRFIGFRRFVRHRMYWNRRTPLKSAKIQQSPKHNLFQRKREAQVRSFYGKYCKEDAYKEKKEETVQAILHAKSKVDLNSQLTKLYPGSLVKQLFELIKPLIEDLPKN